MFYKCLKPSSVEIVGIAALFPFTVIKGKRDKIVKFYKAQHEKILEISYALC